MPDTLQHPKLEKNVLTWSKVPKGKYAHPTNQPPNK